MEFPVRIQTTIVWSSVTAAGVGVPGAFAAHLDVPVLVGIWTTMLIRIAYLAGEKLEKATAAKVVTGVIAAIGGFQAGTKLATTYFAYTGIGTIPAMVVNAGANGVLTYVFGRAAAKVFLANSVHDSVTELIKAILLFMTGRGPSDSMDA